MLGMLEANNSSIGDISKKSGNDNNNNSSDENAEDDSSEEKNNENHFSEEHLSSATPNSNDVESTAQNKISKIFS